MTDDRHWIIALWLIGGTLIGAIAQGYVRTWIS